MPEYIVTHGIRIAKDFIPETLGRLTTIGPCFRLSVSGTKQRVTYQVCQCECGNVVIVRNSDAKNSQTQSCGCLQRERTSQSRYKHGGKGTSEYDIWVSMRQRCNNAQNKRYADYGGRGVCVHPGWDNPNDGFQNFYDYMGPKPTPEHSIDRYPDPNGNYEPGNVRWATDKEQNRNKRSNHILTYDGKSQCINAWAEELGVPRGMIKDRLLSGWSVEDALMTPKKSPKVSTLTCVTPEVPVR